MDSVQCHGIDRHKRFRDNPLGSSVVQNDTGGHRSVLTCNGPTRDWLVLSQLLNMTTEIPNRTSCV